MIKDPLPSDENEDKEEGTNTKIYEESDQEEEGLIEPLNIEEEQEGDEPQEQNSKDIKELDPEKILVELNYVSKEDMEEAKIASPNSPIDHLLQDRKITKDILGQAIAEHYKIDYFDLNTETVPVDNFFMISITLAKSLRVIIVKKSEGTIKATTDQPQNEALIKENLMQYFPEQEISLMYSLSEDIDEAFKLYREELQQRLDDLLRSSDPNFAAQYFDELIKDALERTASDIHLEPNADNVLIRFRVDGMLQEMASISHDYYENILNRIKVLSNVRLDEHYRAQDGAIRYQIEDRSIDLRISIIPIMEGQKVTIRLLADYIKNMSLLDLGLNESNLKLIKKASKKTYGMILATGPTGSGKTTTLYSLIKTLNKPEVNITTIEDPVEYRIPGVNQIQVNLENEMTFSKGLRSIIRQDPNIILVGEIRDKETVEIAVNAALTGHLLLSSFHANNAASAIPRLLDMGVEPFLLASTLNLIVAERLVRRTCASCKYSKEYNKEMLKSLMSDSYVKYFKNLPVRLYLGRGCEKCNFTGYKGRIGIFETIYVTTNIQDLILHRATSRQIWETAQKDGGVSFFEDGLQKVILGEVSLEELIRVAPVETQEDIYGKGKKQE